MRHKEGDAAFAQLDAADLAQLILRLFASDSVYSEATLGIVDEAEVFAGFLDSNHVLEAGWVGRIGANLDSKSQLIFEPPSPWDMRITLPSTLMRRCMTICLTSRPLRAYFSRLRMKTMRGMQSRSL
jgi:hypothetical protein